MAEIETCDHEPLKWLATHKPLDEETHARVEQHLDAEVPNKLCTIKICDECFEEIVSDIEDVLEEDVREGNARLFICAHCGSYFAASLTTFQLISKDGGTS